MFRTFIRPGWIVLGLIVVAFAALCFSILAPWQLGKNSSTEERNNLIRAAVETPVAPIDAVTPAGREFSAQTEWRAVTVTGQYLPQRDVLVRLRSVGERPATEVLTPFAGTDGRHFLIDRGYVRPEQGRSTTVVPAPPSGVVTVTARIRKSEGTSPGRGAHVADGAKAVYTIDPAVVATQTGLTFDDFYLALSAGQPGSLGEIPLPQLDSGPYLSYGLQWLAFGIMAPLGAGYFIYSEVKHRRALRDSTSGTAGAVVEPVRSANALRDAGFVTTAAAQRHQIGAAPASNATDDQVKEKLARRYGR